VCRVGEPILSRPCGMVTLYISPPALETNAEPKGNTWLPASTAFLQQLSTLRAMQPLHANTARQLEVRGRRRRPLVCFAGLARRDRERPLNDGQIPNPNVVRVASGTGYHRVEGNRRLTAA
jgi:hypothetical protein